MKKLQIIIIIVIMSLGLQSREKDEQYYLKINKAFDVFGSIFKELTSNYVVNIDPEILMEKGVEGMLNSLDPYTVYYPEKDNEDIDFIISGSYVGLGIVVNVVDSMLTVVDMTADSPARKSGLRIGDRIYRVDTTIILNSSSDELRKFTKGKRGTYLDVEILREGVNDTISFSLLRDNIKINSILAAKLLENNIAYIKIGTFSKNTVNDFKSSFNNLRIKNKDLSGLIIDLRDNPGGLLVTAVELCELFLPEDTPIVTTRGKDIKKQFTYTSISQPLDTNLPIAVLINSNSASSSEILAGAFQDYDRAVIIGQRTYGKGLVQSVADLPYNGSLKITTAKYYLPSGRCIQKLDYPIAKEEHGLNLHRDSTFFTKNNRIVYESTGIQPDVLISEDTLSPYQEDLLYDYYFFNFATRYASKFDTLELNFEVNDKIFSEFKDYLDEAGFKSAYSIKEQLELVLDEAVSRKMDKKIIKKIKSLSELIGNDFELDYNKDFIIKNLRIEILRRFYSQSDLYNFEIRNDRFIKKSIEILNNKNYRTILGKSKKNMN